MIIALSTYSSPYNDGKLEELGARVESLHVATGDLRTKWGFVAESRTRRRHTVVSLPCRLASRRASIILEGLDSEIARAQPDVIHVEAEPWQGITIQAILAASRRRIPIGVQFAENGPQMVGVGGSFRFAVARQALRGCSYAVGWSSGAAAVARYLAPSVPCWTFPGTGVTSRGALGLETSTRPERGAGSVVFAGRLEPEKGILDFLNVCDRVRFGREISVEVIGDGSLRANVVAWSAAREWVTFRGMISRPEAVRVLDRAGVVVIPSRTTRRVMEQFSLVAAESLALGSPVIAYDCGALRELVGGAGIVVREGDLDALATAILEVLDTPVERQAELSAIRRERGALFTNAAIAAQLYDVWQQFARRRQSC